MHYTYMLKCKDNTYYTGYTNNLEKRIQAHNEGKGAKYTKGRGPVELVYYEEYADKQTAMRREWEMKQLSRSRKDAIIKEWESRQKKKKEKWDAKNKDEEWKERKSTGEESKDE